MLLAAAAAGLSCLLAAPSPAPRPMLTLTASCRGNPSCRFEGKRELFIDIAIANPQAHEIGFPLEFTRKTGPSIRLIDARTHAEIWLKTNLADLELKKKLTPIAPGQAVSLEWVLFDTELTSFGPAVDVTAEISLARDILVNGKLVKFEGATSLRISSHPR